MIDKHIYIMTNPYLPDMVKIGMSNNVELRRRKLGQSGIPGEFECYATLRTFGKFTDVTIHHFIDSFNPNLRVASNREFYRISKEFAYKILEFIAEMTGTLDYLKLWDDKNTPSDTDVNNAFVVSSISFDEKEFAESDEGKLLHFFSENCVITEYRTYTPLKMVYSNYCKYTKNNNLKAVDYSLFKAISKKYFETSKNGLNNLCFANLVEKNTFVAGISVQDTVHISKKEPNNSLKGKRLKNKESQDSITAKDSDVFTFIDSFYQKDDRFTGVLLKTVYQKYREYLLGIGILNHQPYMDFRRIVSQHYTVVKNSSNVYCLGYMTECSLSLSASA